jgi:protein tyrosine kinase modulator
MQELLAHWQREARSAWRFRWWGVAMAWGFFAAGFAWIAWQPNIYEASARVYIDTSSVLKPLLSTQIAPPDVATQLNYVRQAMLGREQLESVARDNNLDVAAVTPAERQAVLETLRDSIVIDTSGGSRSEPDNIYSISYRHRVRGTAVGVVTALLNSLVEDTLGQSREGTDTAGRFLNTRVQEYEVRLQRAETELADFKKRNADKLPGTEGGYFKRMQEEKDALDEAQKALRLAQSQRARLVEQSHSETPMIALTDGREVEPAPNSLDARIRDHKLELDRLLLLYTDQHPDVVAVRERLARLEEQRAEQLRAMGITNSDQELSSLDSNPIYQAIQISLNETDVEIAKLQADVDERTRKLKDLQGLINDVPEVEAELARLNRDYEVIYEQYQALAKSRETQDLTRKASDANQIGFRVIDPPLAAFNPVAPDRLRLLITAFLGALTAGGVLCWLMSQLRPVFGGAAMLREITGLPVIGVVGRIAAAGERTRKRLAVLGFSMAMASLVAVFVLALVIELAGPGLEALTEMISWAV